MPILSPRSDLGDRYVIVGGAGFIGSHFTDALLADSAIAAVTLYDNFSSGREWHYERHAGDERLRVVRGAVGDLERLSHELQTIRTIYFDSRLSASDAKALYPDYDAFKDRLHRFDPKRLFVSTLSQRLDL